MRIDKENIDISTLNKADVLAALYNASKINAMKFLYEQNGPMLNVEAAQLLRNKKKFNYLFGKVMKIDLSGDILNVRLYDRKNGPNAAYNALAELIINDND